VELKRDVSHIAVQIGTRYLWNGRAEKLKETADWIKTRLRHELGYELATQPYLVPRSVFKNLAQDYTVENIEVEIKGSVEPDKIIIVGAHYDSFPLTDWDREEEPGPQDIGTPGANDNGSGVAAMLALARYFRAQKPKRTIRFVAFANEEPPFFRTPFMGSRQYARRCRERGEDIVLMITPETIGCYQARSEPKDIFSFIVTWLASGMPAGAWHVAFLCDTSSKGIAKWSQELLATRLPALPVRTACLSSIKKNFMLGWLAAICPWWGDFERKAFERSREMPLGIPSQRWSDDSAFWEYGYKAFAVTDTAYLRYKHYHEPEDLPEKLNYEQMARVVEGIRIIVDELANP
jgi:hypothetical protein